MGKLQIDANGNWTPELLKNVPIPTDYAHLCEVFGEPTRTKSAKNGVVIDVEWDVDTQHGMVTVFKNPNDLSLKLSVKKQSLWFAKAPSEEAFKEVEAALVRAYLQNRKRAS